MKSKKSVKNISKEKTDLTRIIGWDIGGANIKAAIIQSEKKTIKSIKIIKEYFPIWKESSKLAESLLEIQKRISSIEPSAMGLTMTAELSDAYRTKREGVNHVLNSALKAFKQTPFSVLNVKTELISVKEAKANPIEVAAANWVATGWLISQKIKTCVIVDVGSTSTSIIPIIDGQISAVGKTDLEKLRVGELVYTGCLRTNIAAIINSIPFRGSEVKVSSEFFSQSGDIHIILGNIVEEEYSTETPDSRGRTKKNAMERLARVICGDLEMIEEGEIFQIANYIYSKQLDQISEGLKKVYSNTNFGEKKDIPVVVTGMGKDFMAAKAAKQLGISKIIDIKQILDNNTYIASPAVGVALMVLNRILGENVKWKQ